MSKMSLGAVRQRSKLGFYVPFNSQLGAVRRSYFVSFGPVTALLSDFIIKNQ